MDLRDDAEIGPLMICRLGWRMSNEESSRVRSRLKALVHQYYAKGFPAEEDDYSQPLLVYQRTPEHQRWRACWEKALAWNEWRTLLKELPRAFPGDGVGAGTQPFASACLRCFVYRKEVQPRGEIFITRIAAAVSVLAPLYVVYGTAQKYGEEGGSEEQRRYRPSRPALSFEFPGALKAEADALSRLVEQSLGCRPFPLALAQVPLPGIRVGFFNGEQAPTLLDALFSDDLENLP
ncbi:hypothetical protein [Stigmatella aurantiaca]|uniref:hypothetical protein n=1 Tax=Stigmatella aurantiaca TaxID=41 RepID=UPI0011601448|nr:hypothetical protein [Stigmatella aurantiaca]